MDQVFRSGSRVGRAVRWAVVAGRWSVVGWVAWFVYSRIRAEEGHVGFSQEMVLADGAKTVLVMAFAVGVVLWE